MNYLPLNISVYSTYNSCIISNYDVSFIQIMLNKLQGTYVYLIFISLNIFFGFGDF